MTTCLIIIAIVLAQTGVGKDDHVNEPWVAWFVLMSSLLSLTECGSIAASIKL